ncbi:hypothetical protein [Larkinella arboricola]
MSFWFTQRNRIETELTETLPEAAPSALDLKIAAIANEAFLYHSKVWAQKRLSLSQIMAQARWFILWHDPAGNATPYGFAVLEEGPHAVYGYSLWARQSGRIQRIATATAKIVLDDYLQADRCELTTEAGQVRQFLRNVSHQLTIPS